MDDTKVFSGSFVGITPPENRVIPGSLDDADAPLLALWCRDRLVLQIGCYCGRGMIVAARAAKHVWVIDSFTHYPGGTSVIPGEAIASVRGAGEEIDAKIDLLSLPDPSMLEAVRGDPAYPEFDTIYVDADWPHQEEAMEWSEANLPKGGRLIFHLDGAIRIKGF